VLEIFGVSIDYPGAVIRPGFSEDTKRSYVWHRRWFNESFISIASVTTSRCIPVVVSPRPRVLSVLFSAGKSAPFVHHPTASTRPSRSRNNLRTYFPSKYYSFAGRDTRPPPYSDVKQLRFRANNEFWYGKKSTFYDSGRIYRSTRDRGFFRRFRHGTTRVLFRPHVRRILGKLVIILEQHELTVRKASRNVSN